jgi:hypothetical protein
MNSAYLGAQPCLNFLQKSILSAKNETLVPVPYSMPERQPLHRHYDRCKKKIPRALPCLQRKDY